MTKTITPMTRLQQHFVNLNHLIKNSAMSRGHKGNIAIREHHKTKPKYNPFAWRNGNYEDSSSYSKGIKSDFIRIYYNNKENVSVSFAFSFLHDGEPTILAVMRKGVPGNYDFTSSIPISVDEFKYAIKNFNAVLRLEPSFGFNKFIEIFQSIFLTNLLATDDGFKKIKAEFTSAVEFSSSQYLEAKKEENESLNLLASARQNIQDEVLATDDSKKLLELEKQVAELRGKCIEHRNNSAVKHGLIAKQKTYDSAINLTSKAKHCLEKTKSTFLNRYPWYVNEELSK